MQGHAPLPGDPDTRPNDSDIYNLVAQERIAYDMDGARSWQDLNDSSFDFPL